MPAQDVRRQLYVDEDDRKFFNWVQSQLKQTEKRLEDGRAVLHHLEAQLINVACDDPGAAIGAQLALPLLQERLDARAQDFARQKAAQAEEDIIKMEVRKCRRLHEVQSCRRKAYICTAGMVHMHADKMHVMAGTKHVIAGVKNLLHQALLFLMHMYSICTLIP